MNAITVKPIIIHIYIETKASKDSFDQLLFLRNFTTDEALATENLVQHINQAHQRDGVVLLANLSGKKTKQIIEIFFQSSFVKQLPNTAFLRAP